MYVNTQGKQHKHTPPRPGNSYLSPPKRLKSKNKTVSTENILAEAVTSSNNQSNDYASIDYAQMNRGRSTTPPPLYNSTPSTSQLPVHTDTAEVYDDVANSRPEEDRHYMDLQDVRSQQSFWKQLKEGSKIKRASFAAMASSKITMLKVIVFTILALFLLFLSGVIGYYVAKECCSEIYLNPNTLPGAHNLTNTTANVVDKPEDPMFVYYKDLNLNESDSSLFCSQRNQTLPEPLDRATDLKLSEFLHENRILIIWTGGKCDWSFYKQCRWKHSGINVETYVNWIGGFHVKRRGRNCLSATHDGWIAAPCSFRHNVVCQIPRAEKIILPAPPSPPPPPQQQH